MIPSKVVRDRTLANLCLGRPSLSWITGLEDFVQLLERSSFCLDLQARDYK
jgi:hypothetical protein